MSVFKVERKSIKLEVELTTGDKGELTIYLPNSLQTKKLLEIADSNSASEAYNYQIELLNELVEGDLKEKFIEDLLENGDVTEFLNSVNKEAQKLKK